MGVDLSQEMLSVASMKAGLADLKIDFVHSNAERLPFEKECFDYVLAMGTSFHTQRTHRKSWLSAKGFSKGGLLCHG